MNARSKPIQFTLAAAIVLGTILGSPSRATAEHHETGEHDDMAIAKEQHGADLGEEHKIIIHEAWVRATIGQVPNSAAYLTIHNKGDVADNLLGASATFAKKVEIHNTTMTDNIMKMGPAKLPIEIPAGGDLTLAPQGTHIMLMGLKEKLIDGQTAEITLTFETAGEVIIEMPVRRQVLNDDETTNHHDQMDHSQMDHDMPHH